MEYRTLGATELKVSLIALGTMTWGEQNDEADAFAQMDYAFDAGVNFFDVAEMYPIPPSADTFGATETMIGRWLKRSGRRKDIVIATKVTGRASMAWIRGGPRLNAAQLRQATEGSLRRLGIDCIDLYQLHWPERSANFFGRLGYQHQDDSDAVPIEDQLQTLDALRSEGKIRHIGLSNETPWGVARFLALAGKNRWPKVEAIQNPYSLLNRTFEVGLAEMAIRDHCGLLAYSPLGFGVLSGKYEGGARPKGARLTLYSDYTRYVKPRGVKATSRYIALAREHRLDAAQMALAFVNSRPFTTSNIIGATTMAQLRSNIASVDLKLAPAVLDAIEAIHNDIPNPAP